MRALCVVVLLCIASGCASKPGAPESGAARILITVSQSVGARYHGAPGRFLYADRYRASAGVANVLNALSKDYALTRVEGWHIEALGVYCEVFAVAGRDTGTLLSQLQADRRVESVQLMNEFHTLASARADPYRALQKDLDSLDITAAHRLATGKGVRIALIDTWVDDTHADLIERVSKQDRVAERASRDAANHGTAIAGVIAAHADNGLGIRGVAPQANLYVLAACWHTRKDYAVCNSFTLARALDLAIGYDAQVINLSLGGPPDALLRRLVQEALARGAVVVGAHDNSTRNRFPTSIPGVIGVADRNGTGATVVAPGHEVLTTLPGNRYDFVSGSSIAAAHISGIAALALQSQPTLRPAELAAALTDAASVNACATLVMLRPERHCERATKNQASR